MFGGGVILGKWISPYLTFQCVCYCMFVAAVVVVVGMGRNQRCLVVDSEVELQVNTQVTA